MAPSPDRRQGIYDLFLFTLRDPRFLKIFPLIKTFCRQLRILYTACLFFFSLVPKPTFFPPHPCCCVAPCFPLFFFGKGAHFLMTMTCSSFDNWVLQQCFLPPFLRFTGAAFFLLNFFPPNLILLQGPVLNPSSSARWIGGSPL